MISGTVESIVNRIVNTKFGAKKAYDVVVSGQKCGFGFKDPASMGVAVGTVLTFNTEGKYNNVDMGTLKIGGAVVETTATDSTPIPAASPKEKPGGYTGWSNTFPIPVTHGHYASIRQNALTNARELYCNYHPIDGETPAEIHALEILKIAGIFEDYTSGQREVKAIETLKSKVGKGSITEALEKLRNIQTTDDMNDDD